MTENTLQKPDNFFCSMGSLEIDEPFLGTAPQVQHWLLIEHPGPFGSKALKESDIPENVKSHFNQYLENTPLSKLLLMKNRESKTATNRVFYYIDTSQDVPQIFKTTFSKYEELIDIDFNKLKTQESDEKFLLVCTNGKRDKCCAKYGLPVINRIVEDGKINVWESSHLGQHRFASNLIAFPEAIYYGRVSPETAPKLVEDALAGKINLELLRGRTKYTKPEQAAEGLLLQKINAQGLKDLHLTRAEQLDKENWQFIFKLNHQSHMLEMQIEYGETKFYASCEGEKTTQATYYHIVAYK